MGKLRQEAVTSRGEQVPGTLLMGRGWEITSSSDNPASDQPKLCPQSWCPCSGLALWAAWQGGAALECVT